MLLPADVGSGGPATGTDADEEVAGTGSAVALDERAEWRGGEISWSLRMDLKGADICGGGSFPFLSFPFLGREGEG